MTDVVPKLLWKVHIAMNCLTSVRSTAVFYMAVYSYADHKLQVKFAIKRLPTLVLGVLSLISSLNSPTMTAPVNSLTLLTDANGRRV